MGVIYGSNGLVPVGGTPRWRCDDFAGARQVTSNAWQVSRASFGREARYTVV
jgi:hypothetical protein